MTDGVRTALGGLSVAAAMTLIGAFLMAFDQETVAGIGGFVLFLAGLAAVVCFFRIGIELTRGQPPKTPIRRRDRQASGRAD